MKKIFLFITSVFLVLALNSCSDVSSDNSKTGISISLPAKNASSRSASDGQSTNGEKWYDSVTSYKVTIEKIQVASENEEDNNSYIEQKEGKPGEEITFSEIKAGTYLVMVIAYNEDTALGEGSNEAVVTEGEQAEVKITIKKYEDSDDSDSEDDKKTSETTPDDERTEISYGGSVTVTIGSTSQTFDSLSKALVYASQNPPKTGVNTITLNGNVSVNLIDYKTTVNGDDTADTSTTVHPWLISQNLIIDLNGKYLCWGKFSATELNTAENPLFQIEEGATLLIKNGTITSESGVKHQNILIGTTGGTVALEDITIKDVSAEYILTIMQNQNTHTKGSLYTKNITVKDCKAKNIAIYVTSSYFYALSTTIENALGGVLSVRIENSSNGAFVGGTIALTSSETLSTETEAQNKDAALVISNSNFALSSSTVYSKTSVHGIPVIVTSNGVLNLSDGFTFKSFKSDTFEVDNSYAEKYITAETLGLDMGENAICAGTSSEITKSVDSTETAIYVGTANKTDTSEGTPGALYISGNSAIYGVTRLFLGSSIGQTGVINSDNNIKINFGNVISEYANLNSGNYPLFWAAGTEITNKSDNAYATSHFQIEKFEVYDNSSYTIKKSTRVLDANAGNNAGNAIYAPLSTE